MPVGQRRPRLWLLANQTTWLKPSEHFLMYPESNWNPAGPWSNRPFEGKRIKCEIVVLPLLHRRRANNRRLQVIARQLLGPHPGPNILSPILQARFKFLTQVLLVYLTMAQEPVFRGN